MYDWSSENFVPRGFCALATGLYWIKLYKIFRCLLLWNCFSNCHQISLGTFCQTGIANLFKWFREIEQDGRHAHIWKKNSKNLLFKNQESVGSESLYIASRTQGLPNLFKWWLKWTIDLFYGKVILASPCIYMGENVEKQIPECNKDS